MARNQAAPLFSSSALQPAQPRRTGSVPAVAPPCQVGLQDLVAWAAAHQAPPARVVAGGLRFAFY